uniref:DUF7730 domain-containing protein n=1 Tax=Mycena chlorophos TaxID=658473 RepID=A0ABQ0LL07_MYCCL|nr:predicted protein [Mycena chlorophos]
MVSRIAREAIHCLGVWGYTLLMAIVCPCLLCTSRYRPVRFGGTVDLAGARWASALDPPKPLKRKRIDIRSRQQATQPENCAFLHKLPLELRLAIYEQLLGGRQVRMFLSDDGKGGHRHIVNSRSFPQHAAQYTRQTPEPKSLSIALLRVCRQIYVETHGLLFSDNIFDVFSIELDTIMRCGLGTRISAPYIRRLRVHHWYRIFNPEEIFNARPATLAPMFSQISAMKGLTSVSFVFTELRAYNAATKREALDLEFVLKSTWIRQLLAIRLPSLKEVGINLVVRGVPEQELPLRILDYPEWKTLEKLVNELMVGEAAQERYSRFLAQGPTAILS